MVIVLALVIAIVIVRDRGRCAVKLIRRTDAPLSFTEQLTLTTETDN